VNREGLIVCRRDERTCLRESQRFHQREMQRCSYRKVVVQSEKWTFFLGNVCFVHGILEACTRCNWFFAKYETLFFALTFPSLFLRPLVLLPSPFPPLKPPFPYFSAIRWIDMLGEAHSPLPYPRERLQVTALPDTTFLSVKASPTVSPSCDFSYPNKGARLEDL
jgi:hypothetical protein